MFFQINNVYLYFEYYIKLTKMSIYNNYLGIITNIKSMSHLLISVFFNSHSTQSEVTDSL